MMIGERGREVILIETQFATLPLKSFPGDTGKVSMLANGGLLELLRV